MLVTKACYKDVDSYCSTVHYRLLITSLLMVITRTVIIMRYKYFYYCHYYYKDADCNNVSDIFSLANQVFHR